MSQRLVASPCDRTMSSEDNALPGGFSKLGAVKATYCWFPFTWFGTEFVAKVALGRATSVLCTCMKSLAYLSYINHYRKYSHPTNPRVVWISYH